MAVVARRAFQEMSKRLYCSIMPNTESHTEKETVLEVIGRVLKIDPATIRLDDMIENLAEDSVQLFSLILAFEQEYRLTVNYDELVEIETVGDIVAYIDRKGAMKHKP